MLKLIGWLVVIALVGFIIINLLFEIIDRFLAFAETNLTTVLIICLVILVVVLSSL
jgi:hypothetical protein